VRRLCIWLNLIGILLWGQFLYSQTSGILTLTLDRAVELALQKNSDITVARLEVKKSAQKVKEAASHLFPSLDASGQYTRNIKKPVIFLPPGTPFSPPGGRTAVLEIGYNNAFTGSISLSLPIFVKSAYSGLNLAKQGLKLSREAFQESKIKTITNVKKAFYGVLLAKAVHDYMKLSLQNAESNLDNVKKMHHQGLVADYDLIRAEVQVENLRPIVMQAEDNLKLAKDQLKIRMGLEAEQAIEIQGTLTFDSTYQIPPLEEALQTVLSQNTTLRQLQFQEELTRTQIGLEKAAFYPQLVAFGNYRYQTQANDFNFSNYRWVETSMIGLQLQFPLFHGLGRFARVQQAELKHRQIIEQQGAIKEAIKTQLESVLYRMRQTRKRVEAQKKAISQAELGYRIAKSRYKNGIGTQLEVNDAEVALTQARVNYARAVYDFLVAIADYEELSAKPDK